MTGATRLAAALAVVLAGLASRAAVDALLARAGGAERVAAWAQLQSAADLVTGVAAAGLGAGLTVLVAGSPGTRHALLRAALVLGLCTSGVAFGVVVAVAWGGANAIAAGASAPTIALAAGAGWFAVVASLVAGCWAGEQRTGRVLALTCASGLVAIAAAAIPRGDVLALVVAHALPGAVLALWLLARNGRGADAGEHASAIRALRHYLPVGIAIGVASPAALLAARALLADALGWNGAGTVQALWRASDWVTSLASGVLAIHFLPVLSVAAGRGSLRRELGRAALVVLPPAALALALLAYHQRAALGFLYGEGFLVPDAAAAMFFAGDFVRVVSWLPLFALYALRRTGMLVAGEFFSLPLFALLLWFAGERLTIEQAGAAWLAAYAAYALFNAVATVHAGRRPPVLR